MTPTAQSTARQPCGLVRIWSTYDGRWLDSTLVRDRHVEMLSSLEAEALAVRS